jgi:hypothetical protein
MAAKKTINRTPPVDLIAKKITKLSFGDLAKLPEKLKEADEDTARFLLQKLHEVLELDMHAPEAK